MQTLDTITLEDMEEDEDEAVDHPGEEEDVDVKERFRVRKRLISGYYREILLISLVLL